MPNRGGWPTYAEMKALEDRGLIDLKRVGLKLVPPRQKALGNNPRKVLDTKK